MNLAAARNLPLSADGAQRRKLGLWPLVAATFFLVCGGTYGTEEIIGGAGYGLGILILFVTPLVWSYPVALMLGELSSALPAEGGFYAWVRRAMGNFWGFQEAWLSLSASVFDMAIYPTLFVLYLTRVFPWFGQNNRGLFVGLAMVVVCALLNVAGIRVVALTSEWLFFVILAPFALIVLFSPFQAGQLAQITAPTNSRMDLLGGLLIAMWNYMGWDNASTIAAEVDHPQRNYPTAMLIAVTLVAATYVLPFTALWLTGFPAGGLETGSWADAAASVGGPLLRLALVIGGMVSAFGMFNALVMSYSRLPLAMAQDGMLPRPFAWLHPRTRAPWVSILALSMGWALCLGLGFNRLITLDLLLYGLSLSLEFVALVTLRIREPNLPRPFRVPGGLLGAVAVAVLPVSLLGLAVARSQREEILGVSAFWFGAAIILLGVAAYPLTRLARPAEPVLAAESVCSKSPVE